MNCFLICAGVEGTTGFPENIRECKDLGSNFKSPAIIFALSSDSAKLRYVSLYSSGIQL